MMEEEEHGSGCSDTNMRLKLGELQASEWRCALIMLSPPFILNPYNTRRSLDLALQALQYYLIRVK